MHAKHRNGPGNGHRSNNMGMGGVAAASRIPPEGSMRGYRMYNSEYRNYNRGGYGSGGGGGHSKQYQPPLPPPRETDIFMEAGRMAAEYLVSKGMLPPNALSGKWQSDGLKNQVGNFQGYRSNEAEKLQTSVDGRASAHSRLGNAALDVGPGRRKYSDEYNSVGSRSSNRGIERGRKRTGSFRNYGSEVSRELGRSGSLTEKIRTFHGAEAESDSVGYFSEQPAGKDGNYEMHKSSPGETTREIESETQTVSGLEKRSLVEDANVNNSILSNEKCLTSDANAEATKKSDNESELVKAVNSDNELQQKNDEKKEVASSGIEDTLVGEDHVDLVKQCKFVNVPTKTRSSLTIKGLKGDQNPIKEEESISKREHLEDSGMHVIDVDIENSAVNAAATHQNHELKSLPSDDPTSEKEMNITYSTRSVPSLRSESFAERSLFKEQQTDVGLSGFGRSKSMFMERGEKRAIDCNPDGNDDLKKLKQWVPTQDASNGSPPTSSSTENKPLSQEPSTSQAARLAPSPDRNSLDISLFSKDHSDSSEFMREKQLFPSSFKTCDLNLVGACDVSENHDADPMLVFSSITQTGKAATRIDVDLSMGNNGNMSNKTGKHSVNEKDIEVIDLEKESAHEDKTYGNSERRLVH